MGFSFRTQENYLRRFDRMIANGNLDYGVIDDEVINAWECRFPGEGDSSRNGRLQAVSGLADYMEQKGIPSSHPCSYGIVRHKIPYLPSEEEIAAFLNTVDCTVIANHGNLSRLPAEYSIMFRLYFLAGLRLNEPIVLKRKDVSLENGELYIRHSKGDKDRRIIIADDFAELIRRYDSMMDSSYIADREWFFPGFNINKPFSKTSLDARFRHFWDETFPEWKGRKPTVHSLRHAFVINRINAWAKDGLDFETMVPALKTYLGHSSTEETYYYYHMLNPREQTVRDHLESTSICKGGAS